MHLSPGEEDDVQFQVKAGYAAEPGQNYTDARFRSIMAITGPGLQVISGDTSMPGPMTEKGLILTFRVRAVPSEENRDAVTGYVDWAESNKLSPCAVKPYNITQNP